MPATFTELATSIGDLARQERMRHAFTREQALIGGTEPPSDTAFAGWRVRTEHLAQVAELLTALIPHEAAVRALEPALLAAPAAAPAVAPSMWEAPDPLGR